jgi:hypothetical protein
MKRIDKIIWSLLAVVLFGCNTLDVPPMNIVKDVDLFTDQAGVTAYIARLYQTMPMIDRQDYGGSGISKEGFEALGNRIADVSVNNNAQAWWDYACIRSACYFIQEFPAYANNFGEKFANAWLGEAYFVRAYCYFRMVQLYGGIPIVDRVLNYPQETIEELKLPRNKEADCWDFILNDLEQFCKEK